MSVYKENKSLMEKYFKRYKIEAEPFNSDILSSILWELNIDGICEEDNFLFIFTSEKSSINKIVISSQLNKLKKEDLINNFNVEEELIQNKNWNEEWEKTIDVVNISDRIVIKPSFREYKKKNDEFVITIDPKMSFGTGKHTTTKLVVQMLEKYIKAGDNVLDVGSGTGILAITAIKLGSVSAVAIDNDDWCYENAIENCKLNNVEEKIDVRNCELAQVEEKDFSVIISNIQKNVLKDLAKDFKNRIKEKGILILSGLLENDKKEMIDFYSNYGYNLLESKQLEEWISLVFQKK
ncbi:MAG: 50S ribosomal protein L11 methyltransferase [Ignavibacteriales bacterium CG12_big_fil_rev_8_21_14_0_65_30_8]|nr:MAG: 50S ribosomal protein L11 methyltransferase [Ignavibacteriales bacterium CG12_big_fil_rev_8_21_14_0_65_30_8]